MHLKQFVLTYTTLMKNIKKLDFFFLPQKIIKIFYKSLRALINFFFFLMDVLLIMDDNVCNMD